MTVFADMAILGMEGFPVQVYTFKLVLTLGAHAQRGLQYLVCHSVRLSGTTYSATTRNKAAKKRYQRVQCHTGLILKIAIFIKVLRSTIYI